MSNLNHAVWFGGEQGISEVASQLPKFNWGDTSTLTLIIDFE